uniref:Uncharacterized protein n=1 Tax=Arion vulgaris TaxID=1028688 RepID=A0A0B7ASZ3_9EUPU
MGGFSSMLSSSDTFSNLNCSKTDKTSIGYQRKLESKDYRHEVELINHPCVARL